MAWSLLGMAWLLIVGVLNVHLKRPRVLTAQLCVPGDGSVLVLAHMESVLGAADAVLLWQLQVSDLT